LLKKSLRFEIGIRMSFDVLGTISQYGSSAERPTCTAMRFLRSQQGWQPRARLVRDEWDDSAEHSRLACRTRRAGNVFRCWRARFEPSRCLPTSRRLLFYLLLQAACRSDHDRPALWACRPLRALGLQSNLWADAIVRIWPTTTQAFWPPA